VRPGKLFRTVSRSVLLFPFEMPQYNSWKTQSGQSPKNSTQIHSTTYITPSEIFLVVSTDRNISEIAKVARYFDIYIPWVVLCNEKIGMIEAKNVDFLDVTPFTTIPTIYSHVEKTDTR